MGRMNHKLSLGTTPIVRFYVIYVSDFITPRNSGVDPSLRWGRGWVCDQGVCDHGGAGVHTPRLTPSPPTTVNKRVACILLECFLVDD